jgi:hypothetical protein
MHGETSMQIYGARHLEAGYLPAALTAANFAEQQQHGGGWHLSANSPACADRQTGINTN